MLGELLWTARCIFELYDEDWQDVAKETWGAEHVICLQGQKLQKSR